MNQFDFNNQTFENFQPRQSYVTYIPQGFTPETYEEHRNLRKIANIIGGAFLIMLAASTVLSTVLGVILQILAFSGADAYNYLSDSAFLWILEVVLSTTLFTFPFILLFKAGSFRISSLIRFKKPKREDIIPYGLLGFAFCAIANMSVLFMGSFFSSFGIDYEAGSTETPTGFFGFMLTFIAIAVVPALVEEFACRGLILGSLRKYGDGFAIFTSAVIFGIMHGNFQQIPFAFLLGLALGFITVKTGSIWLSVGIHALNNAISVIFDYLLLDMDVGSANIIYAVFLIISLMLGILGVYLLRNRKGVYRFKKDKTKAEKRKLYKWFFTSPTIIIFIILSFVEAFSGFL